jgi:hypothetical protein
MGHLQQKSTNAYQVCLLIRHPIGFANSPVMADYLRVPQSINGGIIIPSS